MGGGGKPPSPPELTSIVPGAGPFLRVSADAAQPPLGGPEDDVEAVRTRRCGLAPLSAAVGTGASTPLETRTRSARRVRSEGMRRGRGRSVAEGGGGEATGGGAPSYHPPGSICAGGRPPNSQTRLLIPGLLHNAPSPPPAPPGPGLGSRQSTPPAARLMPRAEAQRPPPGEGARRGRRGSLTRQ